MPPTSSNVPGTSWGRQKGACVRVSTAAGRRVHRPGPRLAKRACRHAAQRLRTPRGGKPRPTCPASRAISISSSSVSPCRPPTVSPAGLAARARAAASASRASAAAAADSFGAAGSGSGGAVRPGAA
jgi:hypothetical protein